MNIPMPGKHIPPQKATTPRTKPRDPSEVGAHLRPMTYKPFAGSQELEDLKNSLETTAPKYKSVRNNKENNR